MRASLAVPSCAVMQEAYLVFTYREYVLPRQWCCARRKALEWFRESSGYVESVYE